MGKPYSDIQKENRLKLIKYFYARGDSVESIAYSLGMGRSTVWKWLVESDATLRRNGRRKLCPDLEKLQSMASNGYTVQFIADTFGVGVTIADRWLREHHITIDREERAKRQAEERAKQAKKKKKCKTCVYRGYIDGKWRCAYILKVYPPHSRGCSVIDCDKYIKGKEIKKEWGLKAI